MDYKHLLKERHLIAIEDDLEPSALTYVAFRNRESLRAWRQRRIAAARAAANCAAPPRNWLSRFALPRRHLA